jgi:hypothetical protein
MRSKESVEPLDGVFVELAFEHARDLGLANAHELPRFRLRELSLIGEPIDFRHDLSFQEMRLRIRQSEVGENITAAPF